MCHGFQPCHTFLEGRCRQLAQVYIRAPPLQELPDALLLALFAAADGYGLNRRLCQLERTDRRAPDPAALACGVATLLRQFHPCYGQVGFGGFLMVSSPGRRIYASELLTHGAGAAWCPGCLTCCVTLRSASSGLPAPQLASPTLGGRIAVLSPQVTQGDQM